MRVLVTGGAGYLGSVLLKHLIDKGYNVTVVDCMLYGENHIKGLDASVVKADIRDSTELTELVPSMDAVIHLAAIVGDQAGDLSKEDTIRTNYFATRNLAELCRRYDKRIVYTSTCSVYGTQKNESLTEESALFPISIYALSKLAAEDAIRNYCKNYLILRLGTLHGMSPRMRFDLVINRFIAQAIQDKRITVFGGEQFRPFLHIMDASDAIIRALETDAIGTYNVGITNMRIMDIADTIKRKTGCEVTVYREIKDPRNYIVDSSKAMKELRVNATHDVEDSIRDVGSAMEEGVIRDYREPIYSNAEWLRRTLYGTHDNRR
ncbi:MAG: SDR family oxidoreductase [Nitrososphaerota archaeon]